MSSDAERRIRDLIERASSGEEGLAALSGYELEARIGEGGMGAVFRARRTGDDESLALKVMLPQIALDEQSRREFLREIANSRALQHPNIVRYRDAGAVDGTLFLIMEYCDGGSANDLMAERGGVLGADDALPIIMQALAGLVYAHEEAVVEVRLADGSVAEARGLVHRDIKPQNILLQQGVAKVGDFGLAKACDTAGLSGHTHTGMAAGTVPFMPRSQLVNFKYAGPEVDVWAMAASLYHMLTGQFPRDFGADVDPYTTVLTTAPVSIRTRRVPVPKRLGDVIDAALVDDPAPAIASARQLMAELRSV